MNNKEKLNHSDIILSDCIVDGIEVNGHNILLKMNRTGIIIKEEKTSKYFRTKHAQVTFEECDIDNISIQLTNIICYLGKYEVAIIHNIKYDDFVQNISMGKWRFEIVEEFYSHLGGKFTGKLRMKKKSYWCNLNLCFENIAYFWNEIDYRYEVK